MKTIKTLTAVALAGSLAACSGGSSSSVTTPSSKVTVPSAAQTSASPAASPSSSSPEASAPASSASAKPSKTSSAPPIKTEPADPKSNSSESSSSASSSKSPSSSSSSEPTSAEALKGGSYATLSDADADVTVDFDATPPSDFDQLDPSYNNGNPLLQGIDQDFAEVTISGGGSDFQVSSVEGIRGSSTVTYLPVSEALARFVLKEKSDGSFLTRDGRTLGRERGLEINAELKRLQEAYPAPEAGASGTFLFAALPDTSSDFAYNTEFESVTVNGALATTRK